jgi:hypothetical protein
MYGFPTQTEQETIDSLEVVRQLLEIGAVQSGFWHQFAMTAHSPIGLNPEDFNVTNLIPEMGTFANNDLYHSDKTGCNHALFSDGLKKSLFNYMHGIGFELPLNQWFDFKIPKTSIPKNYIERCIDLNDEKEIKASSKIIWIGPSPSIRFYTKVKKGKTLNMASIYFSTKKEDVEVIVKEDIGNWLLKILHELAVQSKKTYTFEMLQKEFNAHSFGEFSLFWNSYTIAQLRDHGLIIT